MTASLKNCKECVSSRRQGCNNRTDKSSLENEADLFRGRHLEDLENLDLKTCCKRQDLTGDPGVVVVE